MAKITLKVKTPTQTWTVKEGVKFADVISKNIERNTAKIVLNKLSDLHDVAIRQQISIWATFFQRVVARTPLDENYSWTERNPETGEIIERHHKKDRIECRYDWYITDGSTKITAKELYEKDKSLFDYVSDANAIAKIADIFASELRFTKTSQRISIYNDNPHFAVLEYGGGYNWEDGGTIKKARLEHGVENLHSVQAPVGMYRITEMELERSSGNTKAKTALSQRFKGQQVRTYKNGETRARKITPTDYQLTQIIKLLKKGHIKYDDIARYIGER